MLENKLETFCPTSQKDWRKWLKKNHIVKNSIWLIYHKKNTGIPSISWSDAVDVALCFGWIDSKLVPINEKQFMQFFCKRKLTSVWSKINKDKVQSLAEKGLMEKAGYASIEVAKQNGSWTILDNVEALIIPADLKAAFKKTAGSKEYYLSLSKSIRKAILQWIEVAKRTETRQKRISEVVELAAQKLKPKQLR